MHTLSTSLRQCAPSMISSSARWWHLAAVAVLLIAACDDKPGTKHEEPQAETSASAMVPVTPVVSTGTDLSDRLALRRLAEQHGATSLYRMVTGGGASARVALAALAEADDAQLIVGDLARRAAEGAPAARRATLEVLLRIASRPPLQAEPLAPDSLARCFKQLDALSRDRTAANADRALAVSALRAFSRAGYYDEQRVLKDLDPVIGKQP